MAITLRSTTAPNANYTNKNATLTHAEMDVNWTSVLPLAGGSLSGSLTVNGNITSTSDENLKTNIELSKGLDIVMMLRGVEFDWKQNNEHSSGVIAQEVEKVIPHCVFADTNGIKSVNYTALIGYLINAIKEQQLEITKLKDINIIKG